MADIFVSYAKTDRSLASKLVAMLEAEGWSVWWDTSLGAADLYRDEIMKQLVSARAVIAIWSPNSIRSDWVRAEAGAAKKDGKLIPVKTADVAYADIPLPFGEMHTENLEASQLVRAAVVAQLAKPAVEPSAAALLTKEFKYELLTWVGIVGGALTLFGNLDTVLKLANWAHVLIENWKELTHAFWLWAFGWLGIHLPPQWTPVLSFLLFGSLLTIGQAFRFNRAIKAHAGEYDEKSLQLISWRTFFCVVSIVAFVVGEDTVYEFLPGEQWPLYHNRVIISLLGPMIAVILFARHRFHTAVSVLLLGLFFWIVVFYPLFQLHLAYINQTLPAGQLFLMVLPLLVLSVAPAKAISRRLIFLALGLLLLIALNELSKLGLDLTAPKLQG